MKLGTRELRWTYVAFGLLALVDLLMLFRAIRRFVTDDIRGPMPADAPLFVLLLLMLQILLGWLFFRLSKVVTHYHRLKDSYEQELDFARQIMEASHQGMLVVDMDGMVTFANRRACELLGLQSEALVGHNSTDFISPGDLPAVNNLFRQMGTGKPVSYTAYLRDGQGGLQPARIYNSPRWLQGRIVGLLVEFNTLSENDPENTLPS